MQNACKWRYSDDGTLSTFQDIHSGCFTVAAHEMGHLFGLTELVRDVPAQAETAACQSVKEHIEQDLTKAIWLWSTRWCATLKPRSYGKCIAYPRE
jgi:hypothetical protein